MSQWNPDDPAVRGLEWTPTQQIDRPIAGVGEQSYSWLLDSTVTEDVNELYTFADGVVLNAYDTVDIYDTAAMPSVQTESYNKVYTSDAAVGNVRRTAGQFFASLGSLSNVTVNTTNPGIGLWHTLINNTTLTPNRYSGREGALFDPVWSNATYIIDRQWIGLTTSLQQSGSLRSRWSQWSFHISNLKDSLTNERVLSLTVACLCQRLVNPLAVNSEYDQPYRIRPALIMNGTTYLGQFRFMPNSPEIVSYTWNRNPVTNEAWTPDDLDVFQSAGAVSWFMSRPDNNAVVNRTAGAIYQGWASVSWAPETRVASARRNGGRQQRGWTRWDVAAVGGGKWQKDADARYLFNASLVEQESVDRRPTGDSRGLQMRALGPEVPDSLVVREVTPRFAGTIPRGVGEPTGFTTAMLLGENGVSRSVDGQPYTLLSDAARANVVSDPAGRLVQVFEFDALNDAPTSVKVTVRSENGLRPDTPLNVTVTASNLAVEVEAPSVQPDMLDYPTRWQTFELPLEITGGWQTTDDFHLVTFTVDAGVTTGWEVLTAFTGEGDATFTTPEGGSAADISWDGIAGFGVVDSTVRYDSDVAVMLGVTPPEPAGVDAEYVTGGCAGSVQIRWAVPEWELSSIGSFDVQRSVDGGVTWVPTHVAVMPDDAEPDDVLMVEDFEAPRNATVRYRVRSVGSQFVSIWSDVAVVVTADDCCGFVFATNHADVAALWFDDVGDRTWVTPDDAQFVQFEGSDGWGVTQSNTDRLDQFGLTLLVAAFGAYGGTPVAPPAGDGRVAFAPLLELIGNKRNTDTGRLLRLPYLTVKDSDGFVWFGMVQATQVDRVARGGLYQAKVQVRELTRDPKVARVVPTIEVPGS
jgi:hypothetical protein